MLILERVFAVQLLMTDADLQELLGEVHRLFRSNCAYRSQHLPRAQCDSHNLVSTCARFPFLT